MTLIASVCAGKARRIFSEFYRQQGGKIRKVLKKQPMEEFALTHNEYIELNNLLKVMGLCETGGMAKAAIAEGLVRVNGSVELRKRCKLRKGDKIEFEGHEIIVTQP